MFCFSDLQVEPPIFVSGFIVIVPSLEIKQKKMMLSLQPNLYPTLQSVELREILQKVLILSHLLQKEVRETGLWSI